MIVLIIIALLALCGSWACILNYEFEAGLYTEVTEWIADTVNGVVEKFKRLIHGRDKMEKPKKVNTYEVELKLEKYIEEAKENPAIRKPISWALYQTWKWADQNEEGSDKG